MVYKYIRSFHRCKSIITLFWQVPLCRKYHVQPLSQVIVSWHISNILYSNPYKKNPLIRFFISWMKIIKITENGNSSLISLSWTTVRKYMKCQIYLRFLMNRKLFRLADWGSISLQLHVIQNLKIKKKQQFLTVWPLWLTKVHTYRYCICIYAAAASKHEYCQL